MLVDVLIVKAMIYEVFDYLPFGCRLFSRRPKMVREHDERLVTVWTFRWHGHTLACTIGRAFGAVRRREGFPTLKTNGLGSHLRRVKQLLNTYA
jgi:hypothetical protein